MTTTIEHPIKKVTGWIGRNRTSLAWFVLIVSAILAWVNPDTFLWRDDWLYLQFFHEGTYSFLRHHFASDTKPLFQYILFAEFWVFGTDFHYYQLVNVILMAVCGIAIFQLMVAFDIPQSFGLLSALLYLLHPTNFVNAFWIIQQSELIHIVLVLFSFLAYRRYIVSNGTVGLGVFALCLFFQNFFYPNGVFYSLLFLFLELLRGRRNWSAQVITIAGVTFFLHLVYALFISQDLPPRESSELLNTIPERLIFFFGFTANSITRLFVPNAPFAPQTFTQWPGLIALMGLILWALYRQRQNKLLVPAVIALLTSSIALAVFRSTNAVIPHYYTSLQLPFLVLILVSLVHSMVKDLQRSVLNLPLIVILLVFGYGDRRARRIFAERNIANQEKMEQACMSGKSFEPADDPALDQPGYVSINGKSSGETAVILYEHLRLMDR